MLYVCMYLDRIAIPEPEVIYYLCLARVSIKNLNLRALICISN